MRNFEVGDMVVCYLENGSHIGFIKSINRYFAISPCFIDFGGFSLWTPDDHIITIRNPRKGNAESRAIVAMLARECRYGLNDLMSVAGKDKELRAKLKSIFKQQSLHLLFLKAKSMLK